MGRKKILLTSMIFLLFFNCCCNIKMNEAPDKKLEYNISSKALKNLKTVYPELYQELLKLPDLKKSNDKNKKAIEQIARLGLSKENKASFDLLLKEGVNGKRKYCTPLEALLWMAYDRDFDRSNPLSGNRFSVSTFIQDAWSSTFASRDYTSERWNGFDEVADRLNSPLLIGIYIKSNISYSYTPYEKEGKKSAKEIFKDKKGACYDQTLLAGYLLKRNGYDNAWGMAVRFNKLVNGFYGGHVGSVYIDSSDNQYYSMDFNRDNVISGPFTSLKEAAEHVSYAGSGEMNVLKTYKCYDIDSSDGKYIKTTDYFID